MNKKFVGDILVAIFGILILTVGYLYLSGKLLQIKKSNIVADEITGISTMVNSDSDGDENMDWEVCNTNFYFFVKYPKGWKVWDTSNSETKVSSCEELSNTGGAFVIVLSPDILQSNAQRLSIEAVEGDYNSLGEYLLGHAKGISVAKDTKINGAEAVWLKDRLLIYHDYMSRVFDIRFSNLDDGLLDEILKTFEILNYQG